MSIKQQLKESFDPSLSMEVLESLESICVSNSISPEDLFYKWEAFSMRLDDAPDLPGLDHILALRANMQQNQPKKKMMNKDSLEALVHSRTMGVSRPKLLPRDLNSRMNPLITPIKSNARKSLDELSSPAYFPSNR
jgi:DNA polymerase alpha subunit B N-terminal